MTKAWRKLRVEFPELPKGRLQRILHKKADLQERVDDGKVGAGYGVGAKSRGVKSTSFNRKGLLGSRKSGAGRKMPFECIVEEVKLWHINESPTGHQVDKMDLFYEYLSRLEFHTQKLNALKHDQEASQGKRARSLHDARLQEMKKFTLKAQKQFSSRLCNKLDVRLPAP